LTALPDSVPEQVGLVPNVDGRHRHMSHPLNGRFRPLDHVVLDALVEALATAVDVDRVDYVVGFPEGGSVPAYAFARRIGRPLVVSSVLAVGLPAVSFTVTDSVQAPTKHIYGLAAGDRVVILEDEITTGRTVIAAARSLRAAGVEIEAVVALLAVDNPALPERMAAEGLPLHVGVRISADRATRPLEPGPPR
jgi:adenine/guanine phosphoribosyltransferase-like PRPP-binding protein